MVNNNEILNHKPSDATNHRDNVNQNAQHKFHEEVNSLRQQGHAAVSQAHDASKLPSVQLFDSKAEDKAKPQKPDHQKPDGGQKPDNHKPDGQKPDNHPPDGQKSDTHTNSNGHPVKIDAGAMHHSEKPRPHQSEGTKPAHDTGDSNKPHHNDSGAHLTNQTRPGRRH